MAIRYRTPYFLVMVDGAFDQDGVWIVESAVVLLAPFDPAKRETLLHQVKRAVLLGVYEESRRGRALGAREVRVNDTPLVRRAGEQDVLNP